jgi:hypothetical protein
MIAAKYGQVEATSMLIPGGNHVNRRDPEIWDTALTTAVDYNQPAVVWGQRLLSHHCKRRIQIDAFLTSMRLREKTEARRRCFAEPWGRL